MIQEADWDIFLKRLVAESKRAINAFSSEHPDEEVCYFAYDSEPCYGYVLTAFNTTRASLATAREQHDYHSRYLVDLLKHPNSAKQAFYHAKSHSVLPFCNNPGDFAYQHFAEIQFPEWQEFYESPDYLEAEKPEDDYLTNRVAHLFCHAIDRLVSEHAFAPLRLASPTLLGFSLHHHTPRVLQILNFPD